MTIRRLPKNPLHAVLSLVSYTLVVFGFSSLFHASYVDSWPLVAGPILAELTLINSTWTRSSFAKAAAARCVGTLVGFLLAYFIFDVRIVSDPIYGNDFPEMMILPAIQALIAWVVWKSHQLFAGMSRPVVSSILIVAYALVIFGISCGYVFVFPLIAPFFAEVVLIRSEWTVVAMSKAVVARFLGIALGLNLFYYIYVLNFVFDGKDPYGEDWGLVQVFIGVDTLLAVGALSLSRSLFPLARKTL